MRSVDPAAGGIVDRIVPEHPDAADELVASLARLGTVPEYEIAALLRRDPAERLAARHKRFRRLDGPYRCDQLRR